MIEFLRYLEKNDVIPGKEIILFREALLQRLIKRKFEIKAYEDGSKPDNSFELTRKGKELLA